MKKITHKSKIAIIGKGTAGCLTTSQMYYNTPAEIDWYYSPSKPAQAVGEGSTLGFPQLLREKLDLNYNHLKDMDGTFKHGIKKVNWGGSGDYIHSFPMDSCGIHFNASKFQSYTAKHFTDKVNIIEKDITNLDNIDADHIINCSGKPLDYTEYNIASGISVNAAFINQCYWEAATFDYTLTMARPYGWVFAIPLVNRCSIGYLYNKNINTEEEIKKDIEEVFKFLKVNPSDTTNSLSFNNYYKKLNYSERVTYNGNASFFLEPLEATSLNNIMRINSDLQSYFFNDFTIDQINGLYERNLKNVELMIALHYLAGSKFKTPFWEYAEENAKKCLSNNVDKYFLEIYNLSKQYNSQNRTHMYKTHSHYEHGTWSLESYTMNLKQLNLYKKIDQILNL